MSTWPLLSLVTFLPLVGAGFIFFIRGDEALVARNARNIALITSVIVFVLSLFLWSGFDPRSAGFQFVEKSDWGPGFKTRYSLRVDSTSLSSLPTSSLLASLS